MSTAADVPPIPDRAGDSMSVTFNRLRSARTEAVDLLLMAERQESEARKTRRRANSKLRAYEHLLEELNGQLTIDEVITQ